MLINSLPSGWAASFHLLATSGRAGLTALPGWLVLLSLTASAMGQDDPFGTSGAGAATEPATEVVEEAEPEVTEQDPLVRAIDNLKPTTPQELLRATKAVLNLRRADVAKRYLQQLLDANPSPQQLAELERQFGPAMFLRLATDESVQPEGAKVSEAVMSAAQQINTDRQRLAELVDRFLTAAPTARGPILAELKRGGPVAASPLIQVLADPQRADHHRLAAGALVALGDTVAEPVLAALQSSDEALRTQVIDVLGRLKYVPAATHLLAPALAEGSSTEVRQAARRALEQILGGVPSTEETIAFAKKKMESFLGGTPPGRVDAEGQVSRWSWNSEKKQPELLRMPTDDAAFAAAAEMAGVLHAVAPDNEDFAVMKMATSLEAAKREVGFDRPLPTGTGTAGNEAAAASPEMLEKALDWSLSQKMHGAAISAVEILGQTGNVSLLEDPQGQPRSVARALLDSNRRVRYAAAQAIAGWNPVKAYPGSSRLPEVLGYFASTGGRRRALIGHPRLSVAQTVAGHFSQLGFETDVVATGREALLRAAANPDYALAILSEALDMPPIGELVQQLRKESTTADLPIGIASREVNGQSANWLADRDDLTLAFPLPLELEAAALETRRLLAAAGRSQTSQAERIRQATFALDTLGKYAEQEDAYSFYDLFRQQQQIDEAVKTPELTSRAVRVLGLLGTPAAQKRIVEVASDPTRTIEDRRAAVEAFKAAIQRRGLLLTRADVLQQYDLYNKSANLDQGTQQILGMLLDAMEARLRQTADQGSGP